MAGLTIAGGNLNITFGGSVALVLQPPAPEGHCEITARFGGFTVTGKGFDMAYNLPSGMMVEMQVAYVDAQGHPAIVDGAVTWASSAENVATVTVDPNNSMLAVVKAAADLGTTQITATADADLGTGTRNVVVTLDLTVVAGEAVSGTISPTADATPIA